MPQGLTHRRAKGTGGRGNFFILCNKLFVGKIRWMILYWNIVNLISLVAFNGSHFSRRLTLRVFSQKVKQDAIHCFAWQRRDWGGRRYWGRFPFTKIFRKFRLGCKWTTTFWFVQLRIFRNKRNCWKGSPVFPVETSQWKICVPFTEFPFLLFLSPGPDLSRSFKRPGVPRLPRMELVANGTRSSQTEIPNGNFPKFFVNGKRPGSSEPSCKGFFQFWGIEDRML